MILTVDLGNTSVKFGVFDGNHQIAFVCVDDNIKDNFRGTILSFLYKSNLREDNIDKAILSCVVPSAYDAIYDALEGIAGPGNIIDINPSNNYGITFDIPNKNEVGDDLVVMCSYAYNLYHRELLVVSMGTCTVLSHVSKDGVFKHCVIAPGFSKIAETLWKNAAQLPEFSIKHTETFLADNTIDAMNIGIYEGYIGMLTHLINGMKKEIGEDLYIIGCGGLGKMVAPYIKDLHEYDPDFVTKGLNYICQNYTK